MPRDLREPLRVVVDSREQTPWSWEPCDVVCTFAGLSAGDYALESDTQRVRGRESLAVRFAIERKGLDDFLGTVSTGWDRFQRELIRMETFPAKVVIVEGNFKQCCFQDREKPDQFGSMIDSPQHSHPALSPAFVARRIAELAMMNTCVIFAGDAQMAAALAYRVFLRRAELEETKV